MKTTTIPNTDNPKPVIEKPLEVPPATEAIVKPLGHADRPNLTLAHPKNNVEVVGSVQPINLDSRRIK